MPKDQNVTHAENSLISFKWERCSWIGWNGEQEGGTETVAIDHWPFAHHDRYQDVQYNYIERSDYKDILVPKGTIEVIKPLEDDSLWLKFAINNISRDEVVKLASEYGFLFYAPRITDRLWALEETIGERFVDWWWETELLYIAKNIYFSIIEGDVEKAKKYLPDIDNRHRYSDWFMMSLEMNYTRQDDSEESAKQYVREFTKAVNSVSETDLWYMINDIISPRIKHCQMSSSIEMNSSKIKLKIIPLDLCTAIWLQFSQVVSRRTEFKQCTHCGKEFASAGYGSHKDRRLCSNSCKQAAYRERRKQNITGSAVPT